MTIIAGAAVGVVLHVAMQAVRRKGEEPERAPVPPADPSAPPPLRPSAEEMTPDELRASGYLPFGVSLASAAGLIALVTGPQPIVDWFANNASLLGM